MADLYVCNRLGDDTRSPTLIARFGSEGHQYWAIDANYAHPTGHAELFAAQRLFYMEERDNP